MDYKQHVGMKSETPDSLIKKQLTRGVFPFCSRIINNAQTFLLALTALKFPRTLAKLVVNWNMRVECTQYKLIQGILVF